MTAMGLEFFSLREKSRSLRVKRDALCDDDYGITYGGEADQTHKSHDNAPAVATGIGWRWRARAALGSKIGPGGKSQGAIPPRVHPSCQCLNTQLALDATWGQMLTPHEVGQARSPEGALFKRPRPRSGRIPESKRPPLQYRLWYLNEEGYCVLVVQLDRRPT